ncbi:ANTAR domain-containing protein [Williamsia muralis]|uniref:ANTAR domain-containing protein n=1 Tax=Williamsia marianensis TaxID=85044 RepID=UPI003F1392FD
MSENFGWSADKQRFVDAADSDAGVGFGRLAREFATLTGALLQIKSVGEVLQQVVDTARHVIADVDVASVSIKGPDGIFHTPAYTDPLAIELDDLQHKLNEGPTLQSVTFNGTGLTESADLATEQRWPQFSTAARELGISAVMSTSLHPDAMAPAKAGTLNLYTRQPRGFTEDDHTAALLLATHASLAVAHTSAATAAELHATRMRQAIDSRDVIGQAKGILMAKRNMSADEAFDVLRRTSQQLNIKLTTLAQTLATRHHDSDNW